MHNATHLSVVVQKHIIANIKKTTEITENTEVSLLCAKISLFFANAKKRSTSFFA